MNVMKTAIAIIAGLSFGMAGVSPAFAWHLVPESTNFTGKGKTSATKNGITLACTASFKGYTDSSGIGYVTGGSFTGELGCTSVKLKNLPWKSTAVGQYAVDLANVTFSSPIGNCGPGTLLTKLRYGYVSFTNAQLSGGCTVSGKILTAPKLSVASGD
jgi:hypothetical protein